jgi:hypothetical protein
MKKEIHICLRGQDMELSLIAQGVFNKGHIKFEQIVPKFGVWDDIMIVYHTVHFINHGTLKKSVN